MIKSPSGVMGAKYATERRKKPHISFRYKVRARVAAEAFEQRRPNNEHPRVLELGCAEGLTLLEIRKLLGNGGDYVGFDLSDELLAAAPPLPGNVVLRKGDICSLPASQREASFDLCVALAVLEHLPGPLAAIREAYRMLRPGGVFVATCPNPFWYNPADRLGLMKGDHHEMEMDKETMLSLTREAGFADVVYRPFMWAPSGFAPYLKVPVSPRLSQRIDRFVLAARVLDFTFVNQALICVKPGEY